MDYQTSSNSGTSSFGPSPLTNKDLRRIGRRALTGNYGKMIGISLLFILMTSIISSIFGYISNQLYLLLSFSFQLDSDFLQYGLSFLLSFLASLLTCIFTIGSSYAYIQLLYGKPVNVGLLFYGFSHQPDRIMLTNMPLLLISLVCSIPSVIFENLYLEYINESLTKMEELMSQAATTESLRAMAALLTIPDNILFWGLMMLLTSALLICFSLPFAMQEYLLVEMDEQIGPKDVLRTSFSMMKGHKGRFFCMNVHFIGWILLSVFFTLGIGLLWVIPYMETSLAAFYLDLKVRCARNRQPSDMES